MTSPFTGVDTLTTIEVSPEAEGLGHSSPLPIPDVLPFLTGVDEGVVPYSIELSFELGIEPCNL